MPEPLAFCGMAGPTLEVAELFSVGRSTVYRAIERQRLAAKAGLVAG